MTKPINKYHALERVFKTLARYVEDSGLGFNEITRRINAINKENKNEEISTYKVRNISNGRFNENKVMSAIDGYTSAILFALGKTDDDLLSDAAHLDIKAHKTRFNKRIEDFLDEPNAERYLEYARLMYVRDAADNELESMKELGRKKPGEEMLKFD